MAHRLGRPVFALGLLLALALPGAVALAQSEASIYLDFDDDANPWTIRTALPEGTTTGMVKFVLEVNALPLPATAIDGVVTEGCCDGLEFDGHYGTYVDIPTLSFDPAYVADFQPGFPTCTYCCPWLLMITFAPSAPVVAGQRVFIGEALWHAYCDISVPCTPPTVFTASFTGVGGSSEMTFVCPPTAAEPFSWGRVRSLYR